MKLDDIVSMFWLGTGVFYLYLMFKSDEVAEQRHCQLVMLLCFVMSYAVYLA
jgi:hypothetical protein